MGHATNVTRASLTLVQILVIQGQHYTGAVPPSKWQVGILKFKGLRIAEHWQFM